MCRMLQATGRHCRRKLPGGICQDMSTLRMYAAWGSLPMSVWHMPMSVFIASVGHLLNTALSSKLRCSRELNPGLMLQLRVTVALTSTGKVIKAHAQVCPRLQTSHLWATPIHKLVFVEMDVSAFKGLQASLARWDLGWQDLIATCRKISIFELNALV